MKTANMKSENNNLKIAARIILTKISIMNFDYQQMWFDNILY